MVTLEGLEYMVNEEMEDNDELISTMCFDPIMDGNELVGVLVKAKHLGETRIVNIFSNGNKRVETAAYHLGYRGIIQ
jgi:hypothetical protein